jgi:hypothetical protein
VLDVNFGGALADHERGRNLPIAFSLCQQAGDLPFTLGEWIICIRQL